MANTARHTRPDQAAGLRRLLIPTALCSISFLGGRGRVGTSSVVLNLGHALVHLGKRVLIIDEFAGGGSLSNQYNPHPQLSMADVLHGKRHLEDIVIDISPDLSLLPFSSPARPAPTTQPLAAQLEALLAHIDFVLIDSAAPTLTGVSSTLLASDHCVIVLADRAEAITDAYTGIKLLSREFGRHDAWLLINRARDIDEARALYNRVASVARQYTRAELGWLGFIPEDIALSRAHQVLQSVIDRFPDAEASQAALQLARALTQLPMRDAQASTRQFVRRLFASHDYPA